MKRLVLILAVLGAFIGGVYIRGTMQPTPLAIASTPRATPKVCYADAITADEVIRLTNVERSKVGLIPLAQSTQLTLAAQLKNTDMIDNHYWTHTSPTGVEPWYWFKQVGYPYHLAGENLAETFTTAQGVMTGWMNSPAHKENVLKAGYVEVGVAVSCNAQTTLITAEYGSRR